ARADDEGVEREPRAGVAAFFLRERSRPLGRLPLGQRVRELTVYGQPNSRLAPARETDRALDQREVLAGAPVARELTRNLQRELVRLPPPRLERCDPELEISASQCATELPLRLRPDGVDHPPSPRSPELVSSTRSSDCDDASTRGDND